jgi:hypothetical protein
VCGELTGDLYRQENKQARYFVGKMAQGFDATAKPIKIKHLDSQ